MGCIALVRCVLVLRCGLAVVVWYPYAGWGTSASAVRLHLLLPLQADTSNSYQSLGSAFETTEYAE